MKVLIINSPLFKYKNPLYDEDSLPPIGLGYIGSILREKGIDVELIDSVAKNIPLSELIQLSEYKNTDFICLNIFTTNYDLVKEFVESFSIPTVRFIIGGLSTKTLYERICSWNIENQIDIVYGDGEFITYDLISDKVTQPPVFKNSNRRVFKVDNSSEYFPRDISDIPLDRSFFENEPIKNLYGITEANIITSRGCIYNCAFCAAARSLNLDYSIREKSSESIIAELRHLQIIYSDLRSIRVLDDLFLKNRNTIDKAIAVFNYFNLTWRSMAHVQTFKGVDIDSLKELKRSGCSELFIGIESGSPKILKRIHKTSDVQIIKENLVKLLKVGISIKGYFIYGFPNETEEDFKMTYDLAFFLKQQSLKYETIFRTSAFQFRPYHGTELYHSIENNEGNIKQINSIEPNKNLSSLVGRLQFNFHSGNYSNEHIDVVHKYIYLTTNLNPVELFKNKICHEKTKENRIVPKLQPLLKSTSVT